MDAPLTEEPQIKFSQQVRRRKKVERLPVSGRVPNRTTGIKFKFTGNLVLRRAGDRDPGAARATLTVAAA